MLKCLNKRENDLFINVLFTATVIHGNLLIYSSSVIQFYAVCIILYAVCHKETDDE